MKIIESILAVLFAIIAWMVILVAFFVLSFYLVVWFETIKAAWFALILFIICGSAFYLWLDKKGYIY